MSQFGLNEWISAVIVVTAILALWTDLLRGKIYNWLTLPMLVLGVMVQVFVAGWSGLGASLIGMVLALALFGGIYWVGALGAGDVKLLMAYGAWCGPVFVMEASLISILFGGCMAAGILIYQGKMKIFLAKIIRFIRSFLIKELELEFPQVDHRLKMPFGIPLVLSAVVTWFWHPLKALGVLWF